MADMKEILTKVTVGGMAYTNLYKIIVQGGPAGNLSQELEFKAKGSQLPTSELGVMEVPYRGRKLKVPSQRTFADWTVTIMETRGMEVRAALESWMEALDGAETGKRDPTQLATGIVSMLDPKELTKETISFELYGIFPTSIGAVELSFDEQTAPLEYQVTFQYSYHLLKKK
jgi:hypothetical protein